MEGKAVASGFVGAAAGGIQVYALRNYADKPGSPVVTSLGNWGQPSALIDLIVGGASTAIGLYSYTKKDGLVKSKNVAAALSGYGLATIAGGVYSGMKPMAVPTSMAPKRIAEQVPAQVPQQVTTQRGLTVVPTSREAVSGIVIRSLQT